jgi:hypothetical protein
VGAPTRISLRGDTSATERNTCVIYRAFPGDDDDLTKTIVSLIINKPKYEYDQGMLVDKSDKKYKILFDNYYNFMSDHKIVHCYNNDLLIITFNAEGVQEYKQRFCNNINMFIIIICLL